MNNSSSVCFNSFAEGSLALSKQPSRQATGDDLRKGAKRLPFTGASYPSESLWVWTVIVRQGRSSSRQSRKIKLPCVGSWHFSNLNVCHEQEEGRAKQSQTSSPECRS